MYQPTLEDIARFSDAFSRSRAQTSDAPGIMLIVGTVFPDEPRDFELPELEREEC